MAGPITVEELDEIYAFATDLGKEAGRLLMSYAKARMSDHSASAEQKFSEKDSAVDIVTKADEGEPRRLTLAFGVWYLGFG